QQGQGEEAAGAFVPGAGLELEVVDVGTHYVLHAGRSRKWQSGSPTPVSLNYNGARRRAGGTVTDRTRERSIDQAEGHHQRQVARGIVPPHRLAGGGPLGRLEGEPHLVGGDVLEDLEQVGRVEADFQGIALVAHGDLL